jgi:hypothetical protein
MDGFLLWQLAQITSWARHPGGLARGLLKAGRSQTFLDLIRPHTRSLRTLRAFPEGETLATARAIFGSGTGTRNFISPLPISAENQLRVLTALPPTPF